MGKQLYFSPFSKRRADGRRGSCLSGRSNPTEAAPPPPPPLHPRRRGALREGKKKNVFSLSPTQGSRRKGELGNHKPLVEKVRDFFPCFSCEETFMRFHNQGSKNMQRRAFLFLVRLRFWRIRKNYGPQKCAWARRSDKKCSPRPSSTAR